MASTDARPVPIKNTAFRAYFPILDNTGALVPGAAGLDSEVSKDGGNYADCTSEATEIQSTGTYFLDLTSTEMNADAVVVQVKTSTTDAKTTVLVFYPQESGDIKVDVQSWLGTAAATPTVAGVPEVDVTHWIGTAAATPTVNGVPEVDVTHWGGTAIASAVILAAANFAANAINAAKLDPDVTTELQSGLATASALSTVSGKIDTIDDFLDTEVAAILADTNELQTDWANGGRLDLLIDAIKAKTDLIPASPAAVGDIPTAAANAAALMDLSNGIETSITPRQALRLILAASAGKLSGAATTTVTIRNVGDSKNRITATVDSDGNRSAVTVDAT